MLKDTAMMTRELPSNFGPLKGANANARITGPCGDTMEFWLKIDKDQVLHATFTTDGCKNSLVCGSTVGYMVQNKKIDIVYSITQEQVLSEIGYLPEEFKHCALLAIDTLKQAIENYKQSCQPDKQCNNDCKNCNQSTCNLSHKSDLEQSPNNITRAKNKFSQIKHKIAVLSGKGGVGKSTIATNLAITFSLAGYKVGLMDVDIHGPSIPTLLNLHNVTTYTDQEGIVPIEINNLKVISIGFFLENCDDALIWRGPMKTGVINQFLHEVKWGELDFLIIDLPPGTGDEPLSIGQSFSDQDSALIVTTPQEVASVDVRKSIDFCYKLRLPIAGIVENMSGFVCPKCNEVTQIFSGDGGEKLAKRFNIPLLGRIPFDPTMAAACDKGIVYVDAYANSNVAKIFEKIMKSMLKNIDSQLIK